jgi:hypothetical protein
MEDQERRADHWVRGAGAGGAGRWGSGYGRLAQPSEGGTDEAVGLDGAERENGKDWLDELNVH